MRQIPFGKPLLGKEEHAAVAAVLDSGMLVHGDVSKQFETDFCSFSGSPHAVSVGSCTAGLHLLYFCLGIGAGDEVIVPAQTHTATAHAVELAGATVRFVDAEPQTGNVDLSQLEAAVTPRTKAVCIVHYLGVPVDMDRLCAIAKKHSLAVIEDCALAVGTYWKGQHVGYHGTGGAYSFYPVKHMTTGEGGIVLTKDAELAQQLTRKRAFGVDRTVTERSIPGVYDVPVLGFNYRMGEINAALGRVQLTRVKSFLDTRRKNADILRSGLRELPEVRLFEFAETEGSQQSNYCVSAILSPKRAAKRFEIVQKLKEKGVGTSIYYPHPVPHLKYYRDRYGFTGDDFPVAKEISNNSIALSVGPHLGADDMSYTLKAFKEALTAVS